MMEARQTWLPERLARALGPGDGPAQLLDGRSVHIRPLRGQDKAAEQAFMAALSQVSRYRRFHVGLPQVSDAALERLMRVDQVQHVALVALAPGGVIVADARYVRTADCCDAEFAVAVADDWQGAGLGREMLGRVARHAREQGVRRLYGDVLWGNDPMLALARSLGAAMCRTPGDATLVRAEFAL